MAGQTLHVLRIQLLRADVCGQDAHMTGEAERQTTDARDNAIEVAHRPFARCSILFALCVQEADRMLAELEKEEEAAKYTKRR